MLLLGLMYQQFELSWILLVSVRSRKEAGEQSAFSASARYMGTVPLLSPSRVSKKMGPVKDLKQFLSS